MKVKVPSLKEILDFLCSRKVRLATCGIACIIFSINLICIIIVKNYNGSLGNIIGWSLLLLYWLNTYLYNNKGYGDQSIFKEHRYEKANWQKELAKKYSKK